MPSNFSWTIEIHLQSSPAYIVVFTSWLVVFWCLKQVYTERECVQLFDLVVLKHMRDSIKKTPYVLKLVRSSKQNYVHDWCAILTISIHFLCGSLWKFGFPDWLICRSKWGIQLTGKAFPGVGTLTFAWVGWGKLNLKCRVSNELFFLLAPKSPTTYVACKGHAV